MKKFITKDYFDVDDYPEVFRYIGESTWCPSDARLEIEKQIVKENNNVKNSNIHALFQGTYFDFYALNPEFEKLMGVPCYLSSNDGYHVKIQIECTESELVMLKLKMNNNIFKNGFKTCR